MPKTDVHAKQHFLMPNHLLNKAKFLEFDMKYANLTTLVGERLVDTAWCWEECLIQNLEN